MTRQEIIEFINANLCCYLATAVDNQPYVRGMMVYKADENGVIFHTGSNKELYQQILKNPAVEICFFNPEKNIQVRVRGKIVIKKDMELKKEIVQARPFLKPWVEKMGYDLLIVFQLVDCVAHLWTFETNFSPKEYVKLTV